MWNLIVEILTNAALIVPIAGFVLVFISGRDERIKELTKMKIEVENFDKKYSSVYRGVQRDVESPSEYAKEEINKVVDNIKLSEQEGRDKLKMFIIFSHFSHLII